jgi:RNA polymerase sigma-70 factor (ECF subfamily)
MRFVWGIRKIFYFLVIYLFKSATNVCVMPENIRSLLKEHHKESYIWALRCCRGNKDEAKEALQESYLKALEGRAKFNGQSEFKTWLFAVIKITLADMRRKRVIEEIKNLEIGELLNRLTLRPSPDLESENMHKQLLKSLSELSFRQEQILRLVFYHGFTIEEAATIMDISVGSARTHYERGKNNLRSKINI